MSFILPGRLGIPEPQVILAVYHSNFLLCRQQMVRCSLLAKTVRSSEWSRRSTRYDFPALACA